MWQSSNCDGPFKHGTPETERTCRRVKWECFSVVCLFVCLYLGPVLLLLSFETGFYYIVYTGPELTVFLLLSLSAAIMTCSATPSCNYCWLLLLYLQGNIYVSQKIYGSQRTTCKTQFSPTMWVGEARGSEFIRLGDLYLLSYLAGPGKLTLMCLIVLPECI